MLQPYNSPQRESSDMGLSTRHDIVYIQEGIAVSSINTAYTFVPCDIANPTNIFITPLKLSTTSANGTALFTTTVGWEVVALDNANLNVAADVDDWVQNTAYQVGNVVLDPDDTLAYVCVTAHTSSNTGTEAVDWAIDKDTNGYWQAINTSAKFIKITHTAAGAAKVAKFMFKITGYRDQ